MRHCDRGGSMSPHFPKCLARKVMPSILLPEPRVPLFPSHIHSPTMCLAPIMARHNAELLPRSVSLTQHLPLSASVCLSPKRLLCKPHTPPSPCLPALTPTHHLLGLLPPNANPTPTLLSLYPFPCFRGTCLDSGSLGGLEPN